MIRIKDKGIALNKQTFNNLIYLFVFLCLSLFLITSSFAKENSPLNPKPEPAVKPGEMPVKVDVKPQARDVEIKQRLEGILSATTWFRQPTVEVHDGVVFLEGKTKSSEHKKWAENLARNTQDVVAVVNHLRIIDPSVRDIRQQIANDLQEQWRAFLRILPFFIFAIIIMAVAWIIAHFIAKIIRKSLQYRGIHPLLADVASRAIAFVCIVIGLYLILQLLGLTTIALTLVGGTGVIGIVLGIAFKNITENLLASILLSIQKPFHNNDLIQVAGITGYVQGLTIRATMLVTIDGFQAQIPNSVVYQSNILNFTINPKRRECFSISVGEHETISTVQEIALHTLSQHPAILQDPEPLILVDSISSGNVNLNISFWIDTKKYSWFKVKSSVIRLIKSDLNHAGISMSEPGYKLNIAQNAIIKAPHTPSKEKKKPKIEEAETVATDAEGELRSDRAEFKKQFRKQKDIDKEHNLLSNDSDKDKGT